MKRRMLALVALLAVLLTACAKGDDQQTVTGVTEPDQTGTEEKNEEISQEDVTKPEDVTSIEQEVLSPVASVRMELNRSDVTDDDGTVLCYGNLTRPEVFIEGGEVAAAAINDVLMAQAAERHAAVQSAAQQAKTDRPLLEETGGFNGYSVSDLVTVARLDGKTVSLLWSASDNLGGAHDSTLTTAWVFDVATGDRLGLKDVTGDYDALAQLLTERVAAEISAAPDRYFSQAAEQIPQLLETGSWYFSDQGLVLLAPPELLAPYAAGTLEFTVSYADLEELLDQQWMPAEAVDSQGEPQIALQTDDGAPAATMAVQADDSGAEMVLWTDGVLEDFRIWRVTSSDGVTWYRGGCCYAADRLEEGQAVGLTAMLPDVMTNVMISYTADGETVYRGIGESGKDGSVFFLELDTVID